MSIKKDIEKTIVYAEKFNCPISKEEIKLRIISNKIYSDADIDNYLKKYNLHKNTNFYRKIKIAKAKKLANYLRDKFKNILFIGITGSVAAGYPKKNDDIDIMVITKKDCLWLTRVVLRWWIWKKRIPHRRWQQKEERDQFCFNLWLDESSLKLDKDKHNLKNAMDMMMMIPLINKKMTYEKFLLVNDWVKDYQATNYFKKMERIRGKTDLVIGLEKNIFDKLTNLMVFWPQYWHMKDRIRDEKIGLNVAFFHPKNGRMR